MDFDLNTYAAKWDIESEDFANSPLSYRRKSNPACVRVSSRPAMTGMACRRCVRLSARGCAPRRSRHAASDRRQRQPGTVSRSRDAPRGHGRPVDLGTVSSSGRSNGHTEHPRTAARTIGSRFGRCSKRAARSPKKRCAWRCEVIDDGLRGGVDGDYPLLRRSSMEMCRPTSCVGKTPLTRGTWHEYWICVHPEAQRKGVGQALQAHAENFVRSRGGERLVLETSGRRSLRAHRADSIANRVIAWLAGSAISTVPEMTASSSARNSHDSRR